ncbi:MAG: hypothetical protein V4674_02210 [Patescibacteria group bacterium]
MNRNTLGVLSIVLLAIVAFVSYQPPTPVTIEEVAKEQPATTTAKTVTATAVSEVKTDPYEGWNTYKNDTYGFSLRYPADWVVEAIDGSYAPPPSPTFQVISIFPRKYRGSAHPEQAIIISPDIQSPVIDSARGGVDSLQYRFSINDQELFQEFRTEFGPEGYQLSTDVTKVNGLPVLMVYSTRFQVPAGLFFALEEAQFVKVENVLPRAPETHVQKLNEKILLSLKTF